MSIQKVRIPENGKEYPIISPPNDMKNAVTVRLNDCQLQRIDAVATRWKVCRAQAMRMLMGRALKIVDGTK